jgi:hypothetical protein
MRLHLCRDRDRDRSTYVALSYCWGGIQSYVTTLANIDSHTKRLDWESIPATIRDAIKTTRDLGIRYLWVDALCIIQDSPEDKSVEIGGMNKIYKDATVTIAAAVASNVQEGFLAIREAPDGTEIMFPCPDNRVGKIWMVEKEEYSEEESGPLYYRAWALQERILSPRLLIYGHRELIWQCYELHNAQVAPTHLSVRGTHEPIRLPADIYHLRLHSTYPNNVKFDFALWKRIVISYSKCSLTLPEDKLPALAGIVNDLSRVWKIGYFAGHWSSKFIPQLCWYLDNYSADSQSIHESGQKHQEISIGRSQIHRAPSWSWASVDGSIAFGSNECNPGFDDSIFVRCIMNPPFQGSSFDEVMSGKVWSAQLSGAITAFNELNASWFSKTSMDMDGLPIQFHKDMQDDKPSNLDNNDIYVLVLSTPWKLDGPPIEGLFLRAAGDEGQFRRIGYWEKACAHCNDIFEIRRMLNSHGFQRRDLTII